MTADQVVGVTQHTAHTNGKLRPQQVKADYSLERVQTSLQQRRPPYMHTPIRTHYITSKKIKGEGQTNYRKARGITPPPPTALPPHFRAKLVHKGVWDYTPELYSTSIQDFTLRN